MSKQLKKISMLAVSSLFVSSNAFAAPPTGYDNWSVTGGVVDTSASCADAAVTCKTIVADDNFMYEELTYTDIATPSVTKQYFRLIVTDTPNGDPTNVAFSSESFVPFSIAGSGIDQGLAVKQYVRDLDVTLGSNFEDIAEIQKGFLRLDPDVTGIFGQAPTGSITPIDETFTTKLTQNFSDADIDSQFSYLNFTEFKVGQQTSNPDSDTVLGQQTSLSQTTDVSGTGTLADKYQTFEFREAMGSKGTSSTSNPQFGACGGSAYFICGEFITDVVNSPLSVDGGVTNVAFANGDDIATTWIAQSDLVDFGAGVTGASINYQVVENRTSGVSDSNLEFNFIDGDIANPVDPFDWDPSFGTAPSANF